VTYQSNLVLAWIWILLGFISGMLLGLRFHQENWLGGYAAPRRRMYRLAHISFFGLGATNLLFYLTVQSVAPGGHLHTASWLFAVGAVSMPLCCVLMAHFPRVQGVFAVPVISLIAAGSLTLVSLLRL
jgi:hypothetical protein